MLQIDKKRDTILVDIEDNMVGCDEWIKTIELGKKRIFTVLDIKHLMVEAGSRFGKRHKHILENADEAELHKLYTEWFPSEIEYIECDEMVNRLRDLIEAEIFPIAECEACSKIGKVCYENDHGYSHKLS